MKRRCYATHRKEYPNYGGRGITVCDEWRDSFAAFLRDMGERPKGMTLDRRDNDGPYALDNCRWADLKTQSRNARSSAIHSFFGEKMTIAEAAERFGINYYTLHGRIHTRGWLPDRAASQPIRRLRRA